MKIKSLNRNRWLVIVTALLCFVGVGIAPASAQPQPIAVGENRTSEVSEATPIAEFTLTVPTTQTARVLVLAITPGFAPAFTLTDPSTGIPLAVAGVDGAATTIQSDVTLAPGVAYAIQVQSGNAVFGQFVLSVQAGPAIQPPTPLLAGQPISDNVGAGDSLKQYSFAADPAQILVLTLNSDNPAVGPQVTLRDADLGQALAVSSARLLGSRFRIPPGVQNYVVDVGHGGSATDEPYTICLEIENGAAPCPGSGTVQPPASTPEPTEPPLPTQPNFQAIQIPANGPCSVAPAGGSPINVRSGPGTNFSIVTQLAPNTIVPVLGRTADSSWYQVDVSGLVGWVSATVVRIGGNNCGSISVIGAPTPPAPNATTEVTPSPSATPTQGATATPSPTAAGTQFEIIATFIIASPTLNFSLPAVYGSTALTAGFVPDPFTVGVTAGGNANANYLGGGCYGYTTSAPTFSVNYTSGAFPTLRFYFIGSGDTTMIINSPSGSYYCVDDSFGTLNPTIDFNSPSSGRYDVWIATYAQGASVGGTLYMTENTGNHP
jgi:hypothetical protein